MTQHFLLSAQARSISLKAVFSMGEDKAYETFRQMRWPETNGEAVCPRCGCFFGGHVKPENRKEDRKDRRLKANTSGKRQCVVIMRERKGKSLPFVVRNEGDAVPYVRDHVGTLATIHADEGTGWDALHAGWDTRRVNHSVAFMDEGVCTNQAESYFSRLRRMEVGTHHHIAGSYIGQYAREASWREDNRRVPNGTQAAMVAAATMACRVSRNWKGYWQRAA